MSSSLTPTQPAITLPQLLSLSCSPAESAAQLQALGREHEAEVLAFLALRPVHTVFMSGLIRDNGLVNPLNRGSFYAYRDGQGHLEGVALIGHATIIEAHSDAALEALAGLARNQPNTHLLRGESDRIARILDCFAQAGRTPRRVCRELLLEQNAPLHGVGAFDDLRLATLADLEQVVAVTAAMIFAENGVNPLEKDPVGIRQRAARRIERGREWVFVENERLIFKASVISETPEVAFIEGIHVHPEARGRGYGLRCLAQLGRILLERAAALCLVVNEENLIAQALYRKAGYTLRSPYETIYLHN